MYIYLGNCMYIRIFILCIIESKIDTLVYLYVYITYKSVLLVSIGGYPSDFTEAFSNGMWMVPNG